MLFAVILMYGCTKKNDELTGTLTVSFSKATLDLSVWIIPAENTSISIKQDLKPDTQGNLTVELNFGNYIINSYSDFQSYSAIGFQIMPGKTTKIEYNNNGSPTILQ